MFDVSSVDLPVVEIVDEVKDNLQNKNVLIVNAPPGGGKSTLLPLALMHEDWLGDKKIIMLEPRRLAAKTIAMRMADLLGESVGESIGYRIRFENRVSKNTKIEVVTEGILTRMLQSDNALEEVGMVIFDEFHERSLFADVALALTRECQQVLREDLRILIMSATLDVPMLAEKLDSKVVISQGRQYPVEIKNIGDTDITLLPESVAQVVVDAIKNDEGDILVFLPGEGEIRKCEGILRNTLSRDIQIHPLFGMLNPGKQFAAIMPDRQGRRKVVLATSIAETSLTIEGVKVVVDCGFGRTLQFDTATGLSRLVTVEITKDAADQRAGRAGRLGPGKCYRMWSKATDLRLRAHRIPEIQQADLTSLVLEMAVWGVDNIEELVWLTPPPATAVKQASELLHQLEAVEDGAITAHGKEINKLPCHPRIAHMLLMAEDEGLSKLATDIAALLEERDPLERGTGIDINLRIEALRKNRKGTLSNRKLQRIEKVAQQYRKMLKLEADNSAPDEFETGLLLVHAYPERIAFAKPGNNAQFKMANGAIAAAGHKDELAHEPWLAVAHVNMRDNMGKIFLASALNPKDLASMVKEKDLVEWDTKRGGFKAVRNTCIGQIILQSKPLQDYDRSQKVDAIAKAISKEGEHLLNFTPEIQQWQNRVMSLRIWNKDKIWPDVSTEHLVKTTHKWLAPYLENIKKPEDLKKINLKEVLQHNLDYNLQQKLDKLAPETIKVPTGSNIRIKYGSKGEAPILAVRLQEVFGLQQTPMVNNGSISMLMHLLSPGYKPVQITGDLASFWSNAYFEVKKELKSRYPKHHWPDNPLEAKPVRK
ncbi:ATP-dependent helicase HrpB [Saccharicrinis aurantiacus]|uniref:ATP-dependent helicase HrpB n=1 Tax=Saccharicrinis aurantiacus TaxID=1849719 RepID=UPI0008393CD6|nr:ATP-dependent helicase HrpB [Saccharicrinis aurantiacus]